MPVLSAARIVVVVVAIDNTRRAQCVVMLFRMQSMKTHCCPFASLRKVQRLILTYTIYCTWIANWNNTGVYTIAGNILETDLHISLDLLGYLINR